jgi:WD40 repeat protein
LPSLTTGSAANAVTQYASPTTPPSPVTSVAMSGDGRSMAFNRGNAGAEWLHLASGAHRLLIAANAVVAVNHDGSVVVFVTPDGECMTDWDGVVSVEKIAIAEVGAIALSAKGTRQAMVAKDGTLWIRDLASGVVATLPPENRTRRWVRWHGDALTIVELKDHTLGLSGGDRYFDVPDSVVELAMSGDGLTLAWFDLHGDIHVLKNLRHARTRQASKYGWPTAVALSADGTWLVVGDEFGFLSLYRTTSLLHPAAIKRVDDGAISTVDVDDEGTAVVFGLENGSVSTWSPSTRTDTGVSRQVPITALGTLMPRRQRTSRPFLARRDRVAPMTRTDNVVLVGDRLGKVSLVDVRTGATSPVLAHGGGPVSSILTQDTGDAVLAHIRRDDDPLVLHSESMHLFPGTTWPGCLDEAQLTALSRTIPDTRILLEIHGTESGTVALRDVAAQHDVATVPNAHVGEVTAVGVGPARTVWTGGADGKVRLWRVEEDPYALVPQHVVEVPGPVEQAILGTTDLLVLAMGEVYAFHREAGTDTGPGGVARAR